MISDKDLDNIINEKISCLDEYGMEWDSDDTARLGVRIAIRVVVIALISWIYNLITSETKVTKKICDNKVGKDKEVCILNHEIRTHERIVNTSRGYLSKCNKTKHPKRCAEKINGIIKKFEAKIAKNKDKLSKISKK